MELLFITLFTVLLALTNAYHRKEPKLALHPWEPGYDEIIKANKWWHRFQALLQAMFCGMLWYYVNWQTAVFFLPFFWFFFDGILNVMTGQAWFYLGTTSDIDAGLRKVLGKRASMTVMLLKIVLLVVGIGVYIHSYY